MVRVCVSFSQCAGLVDGLLEQVLRAVQVHLAPEVLSSRVTLAMP